MSKFTINDIHDYLKNHWYDSDCLSDFNMAIDSGFTEYAAYLIDSAGAIDPEHSFSSEIENAIVKMLENYKPSNDIKKCFGNAVVYINTETNEHAFCKNDYVDYCVTGKDLGPNWELSKRN